MRVCVYDTWVGVNGFHGCVCALDEQFQEALDDASACIDLAPTFERGYTRKVAALAELERWDEYWAFCTVRVARDLLTSASLTFPS